MVSLSEKLYDLSVGVGDIEARADAFKAEQQENRDKRINDLRRKTQERQDALCSAVQAKGDEISSAWNALNQSMQVRAEKVRTEIEAKKNAVDAERAIRRAEHLEENAVLAIEFAAVAMEDAELAVVEAIDARVHAEALISAIEA